MKNEKVEEKNPREERKKEGMEEEKREGVGDGFEEEKKEKEEKEEEEKGVKCLRLAFHITRDYCVRSEVK
ncbi:hypothetical protein M8J76_006464 [Diaphorina citri]|nr:hypothetical protein M8J75_008621 [Diaphorina citri]KAI5749326.1 hypothetical protein M8J76_006464 [Diaphorina citri]